jgi:hypothetical protein
MHWPPILPDHTRARSRRIGIECERWSQGCEKQQRFDVKSPSCPRDRCMRVSA